MFLGHINCLEQMRSRSKEAQMQDQKCPIHGGKLVIPPRPAPSFSWATGYSSLENLAAIPPVIRICGEPGCDYRQEVKA